MLASLFVKIPGDKGKQGHVKGVVGHQSPDVQITVIEMPVHHKNIPRADRMQNCILNPA